MTSPFADDDEMTQLYDADIPRVDLVGKGANGIPRFLIAKQDAAGLLDPGFVRDLIAKSEPDDMRETVTMTGSPGAIAKLIHQASRPATAPEATEVVKDVVLDDSPGGVDPTMLLAAPGDDGAPGDSSDPGSPAWEAIDAATAQKWTSILARAKAAIGLLSQREMLEAASGDEDAIDNSMDLDDACCAIDYAISVLAPFAVAEQSEADCGADMMAAVGKALHEWDTAPLDTIESLGQIKKAGRVLSAANEAAIRGAADALQKVLASLPQAPQVTDGQPVAKEKETTMADNDTASGATDVPETTPAATTHLGTPKEPASAAVPAARDVVKAEKVAQVAIYDADGNLVGTVDPGDVTPLANAKAPAAPAADDSDGSADDNGDGVADAPQPVAAQDLAPAPAAIVGTPADAVPDDDGVAKAAPGVQGVDMDDLVRKVAEALAARVPDGDPVEPVEKTTETTDSTDINQDVLKGIAEETVTAALADHTATQEQVIAKQADDLAQQAQVVKALEDRVKALEEQPAISAVFGNGAVPPAHMMRGQNQGAPVDMTQGQQLRKQLHDSDDAIEKKKIADQMQELAIARFQEMQRR